MDENRSGQLRENAPLYAVSAILALAFSALAVFGVADRPVAPSVPSTMPAPLDALSASAGDEGTILSTLPAEDARARNAAVPFADTDPAAARPFAFRGSSADRVRARNCLALAAMAEAGAGEADQRAVMQVILNRVRHPAFANTVCGVVFQGSERPTGCQFTFTCDGSLARSYSEDLWRTTRQRAEEALGGYVHAPVGTATHYHADYVYPAWSGELDKIASVGPHLFFRWRGWWGSGAAMSARYTGGEPDPLRLRKAAQEVDRPVAFLLPRLAEQGTAVRTITASGAAESEEAPVEAADASGQSPDSPAPGVHFVLVARWDSPQTLVERARALCPGDAYCQVYGWDDAALIPAELPLTGEARSLLRFSFLAARNDNAEAIYFDCRIFASPPVGACLPRARP